MPTCAAINWHRLWTPSSPLSELFLRGTAMYLFLVVLFRILRRDVGSLTLPDLLLVVLIADASQNGMAGEYHSLPEAAVLVVTIAAWSFLLDWLGARVHFIRRLLEPRPVPLIQEGRVIRRNLRRQLITMDEIRSQMRRQGVRRVADIDRACLEPDGEISLLTVQRRHRNHAPPRHPER